MRVELTPQAGDRVSVMCDIANEILSGDHVHEVQMNFTNTGETKYMRTYHTAEELRKFIYEDYKSQDEHDIELDAYLKKKGLR